ncbi:MAG: ATP phosphoribosyltransferase [Candidatus Eisenbacteria bacterium]|uniref:ATP phosphoribosyltransferase n=1 Tax=Eiseniibacteriota bacterium TaxID=2212470 RepID=A0A538U0A0_UNCEI|nr:MAG: ATP phosphoribosyltransferase [Candidatus Eisenbacteria bacterium]
MLKLALPNKGRLAEDTRELFADAGLAVQARGERALSASLGGEFEAIFVRAQDIPEFVADGAADAGVTGRDLVSESGRPLVDLLDLEFGRCRLVVAAREESGITRLADITGAPRVATPFPNLTRGFFERLGRPVEVVPVSGAAEIAPHLGIADIVVDLTTTGSTLRMNGLREIAPVLESSARLIASPRLTDGNASEAPAEAGSTATVTTTAKAVALGELVSALTSVLRARGQRYVMANVPRAALERVKRVLPGLNGPTVVDVLDGGEVVAVHAVAPAKTIYRTIRDLKALGAEGILVTRIERLMP